MKTSVDWKLEEADRVHELVVELASENLSDVSLFALGSSDSTAQTVQLSGDPREFRYATLRLPPGHYTSFGVDARAAASGAKVRIHSWRVLSWPAESR